MKESVIRVLKVEPHKVPEVIYLENRLEVLQTAVSIGAEYRGLIEIIGLDAKTCIICNEEGKLIGLEPNRRLGSDILCGVFYVVGQSGGGDLTSLPEEAIRYYADIFGEPEDISMEEVQRALVVKFITF